MSAYHSQEKRKTDISLFKGSSPKSKLSRKAPVIRMSRRSDVIASYSRDNSAENSEMSDYEESKSDKSAVSKASQNSQKNAKKGKEGNKKVTNGYVMIKGKA